ncbi:ATP-binding protein [Actinoplanes sp. NPDC049548]|uniref:sensor histidine kinase n=1 Tax=Actinoplanes sp. NPDC049548 TaxID=3155152 RepID=UPI0034196ABB
MRLRSPRLRATLVCTVFIVCGYLSAPAAEWLRWKWQAVLGWACGPYGASSWLCQGVSENAAAYHTMLVFLQIVLAALAFVALGWAVQPVRDLAIAVADVGPQNFAFRLHGEGRGEMGALARAVNTMISRVAVGYEAQQRFAADASHELRTPLAVQRTLIEVTLARDPSPEKLRVVTEQLLETNERNVRLIEALLVLAESDRGLVSRAVLRLDAIVGEVLAEYESLAAEAGVTVTAHLEPRPVVGEAVLLQRLVTNLVQNAIKYNRPGGSIEVTVGRRPALVVANTGQDVPVEAVAGLFEPFRRLNGVRVDHTGGAGLGLSIARSIARAHDGRISASSTGKDGLRIEVELPDAGRIKEP